MGYIYIQNTRMNGLQHYHDNIPQTQLRLSLTTGYHPRKLNHQTVCLTCCNPNSIPQAHPIARTSEAPSTHTMFAINGYLLLHFLSLERFIFQQLSGSESCISIHLEAFTIGSLPLKCHSQGPMADLGGSWARNCTVTHGNDESFQMKLAVSI